MRETREMDITTNRHDAGRYDCLTDGIADGAELPTPSPAYGSEWKDKRFNLEKGYSFWLNAVPVRMFTGCALPSSVSMVDCGRMYRCAMLMQARSNMLFYHANGVDKPLTVAKLAAKLGINEQRCRQFVKRMTDARVMVREDGRLYVNPCYFFRGKHLSFSLYQLFQTDLDSVLPQWVIDRYNGDIHA